MAIELVNVRFGLPDTPSSAIAPLLLNFGTDSRPVGGNDNLTARPEDSPIAVISNLLDGDPIVARATFRRTGAETGFRTKVVCEGLPADAVFGDVFQRTEFNNSNEVSADLIFHHTKLTKIIKRDITLHWTITPDGVTEAPPAVETRHRLYVTLSSPGSPWTADLEEASEWLWVEVLDIACAAAEGVDNPQDATAMITEFVSSLGGKPEILGGLSYTGSPHYTLDANHFDCAGFLRHITGHAATSKVNCSDVATIVSTFSNALGTRLLQSRSSGGATKLIRLIGSSESTTKAFTFHELVWDGIGQLSDFVWDASLAFDDGFAKRMLFSTYSGLLYVAPGATAKGPPFNDNRTPVRRLATLPSGAEATLVVSLALLAATPTSETMPLVAGDELAQPEWAIASAAYLDENRLEREYVISTGNRARIRHSCFSTPQDSETFLSVQLSKVAEKVVPLPGLPGRAFCSSDEQAVFVQLGTSIIIAQTEMGEVDLLELLNDVLL